MAFSTNNQCHSDTGRDMKKNIDSVSDRVHLLYVTSKWSDCTFLVGGEDDFEVFQAHKLILASSSPVFEAMCYGALAEQYSVKVPDIEPNAFRTMLQYIYTDAVKLSCVEEACETLYAAKKYMLTRLIEICREYILNHVSATTVVGVFEFAEDLGETDLIEPCLQQICRYANHIFATQNDHMKPSTLATIMKQNDLNISELKLFDGVVLWSKVECQLRHLPQTSDNCRSVLVEAGALCNIRFLALSEEDFVNGPSTSDILSEQERNAIWNSILLRKKFLEISKFVSNSPEDYKSVFFKNSDSLGAICRIVERRRHVPLKLFYCIRSFLKTSRVISGSPNYVTKVAVSNNVFMNGVRFFSRLMPQNCGRDNYQHIEWSPAPTNMYQEVMQISIHNDQNVLLSKTVFRKRVEYSTKVIAFFESSILLLPDAVYSITFKSLASCRMDYPTAFLGEEEKHQGIVFSFWDCTSSDGCTMTDKKDMGFLDSIVFSPA